MPNVEPVPRQLTAGGQRVEHLVVCRESAAYDYALMEGMIGQTVGALLDLPGAEEVLAAGLAPLLGESEFPSVHCRRHGTRAAFFEHRGVVYLYSLGSAATPLPDSSDNAFVELLCDVIESCRPRCLHVATFSRLVRAMEFSGRLYGVVQRHVDTIHCGAQTMRMSDPAGKAMWSTFSLVADMERDAIVQRLVSGRVQKYLRGKWILTPEAIPPGYQLGDDGKVRVDASARDQVNALITLMADYDLTARDVVDAAGRLGLTSPTIQRLYGEDATFADLRRADSRLASLVDWMRTYRTGTVTIFERNPYPGAKRFGPLTVEGAGPDHPGHLRFTYDWGLPEGGWADPALITAAAQRTTGTRARRGPNAKRRRQRPLSGWPCWHQDGHEYWLTGAAGFYIVVRRPGSPLEPVETVEAVP